MMRLVTYNIHKGIGGSDRRYDLERIIEVLQALDADFLCLQEVTIDLPRTSSHDQAVVLAERFQPMFAMFQQNVKWKVGGYGNLLLSRWPLREQHRISLQFGQKKPRGAQLVVVETPSGLLRVTNWHLGLSEGERHWQTQRLLTHPVFHSTAEHPTLMCGDFNDWRDTLGKALLLRILSRMRSERQLMEQLNDPSPPPSDGDRKNPTEVYDIHATMLHLLGLDHEKLSFYHNGIQRRLTDVHGKIIQPLLA